jgi:hypothetical protein
MDALESDDEPVAIFRLPDAAQIMVGGWLFTSAFVWNHTDTQETNAWVVALLVIGVSLFAMIFPWMRHVNTVFAVWLFVTAFAFPSISQATVANNALVAIVIFCIALTPKRLVRFFSETLSDR